MKELRIISIVLFSLVLLTRCNSNPTERIRVVDKELPIEIFVQSFMENHKDFNTNDITRERTNTEFRDAMLDTLEVFNILKGVPVKLQRINETQGRCVAQFQSWIKPDGFKYKNNINNIYFDVIGTIPDSLSTLIKENVYYTFEGNFISRVDGIRMLETMLGKTTRAYTNAICIEKDYADYISVSIGILYFDLNRIEIFKGREKIEEKY